MFLNHIYILYLQQKFSFKLLSQRFLSDKYFMSTCVFKKFALLILIGYSKMYILSYFLKINDLIYLYAQKQIPWRTKTTFCTCLIVPLNPYSSEKAMEMYLLTYQQNIWWVELIFHTDFNIRINHSLKNKNNRDKYLEFRFNNLYNFVVDMIIIWCCKFYLRYLLNSSLNICLFYVFRLIDTSHWRLTFKIGFLVVKLSRLLNCPLFPTCHFPCNLDETKHFLFLFHTTLKWLQNWLKSLWVSK